MTKTQYSPTFPSFPADAAAVTTSDTVNFAQPSVLFAGSGGTIRVLTVEGSDVTFNSVQPGAILPVRVVRVFASTTTAINMVRIF